MERRRDGARGEPIDLAYADSDGVRDVVLVGYKRAEKHSFATTGIIALLRVDQITSDCAEKLQFPGSAAIAKCALRTLRRMLHKAEEWRLIGHAPSQNGERAWTAPSSTYLGSEPPQRKGKTLSLEIRVLVRHIKNISIHDLYF